MEQEFSNLLSFTDKGKIFWKGDFKSLQTFVEKILQIEGKWTSPGGNCKAFQNEEFSLRWYTGTESVTLSGQHAETIKGKLASLSQKANNIEDSFEEVNLTRSIGDETRSPICILNKASLSLENEMKDLTRLVQDLTAEVRGNKSTFDIKLHQLFDKVEQSYQTERERQIINLRKENAELKVENKDLLERVNNLAYILSDLKTKADNAEDEKTCLVKTIRLLQSDNKVYEVPIQQDIETDIANLPRDLPENGHSNEHVITSARSIEVLDADTEEETEGINSKKKNKQKKKKRSDNAPQTDVGNQIEDTFPSQGHDHDHSNNEGVKKLVFIAGDSTIQHVHGWELSNAEQNVAVKSFSGSKVDDMEDYLKPLIRREPQELIVHVGTNDIKSAQSPDMVAKGIVNLVTQIQENSPRTKVTISGLTIRRDNDKIQVKIKETNKILKSFCNRNNLGFINHDNIDLTCLNRRGLHLNRKGSNMISRNFMNHLN